jgi:SAM-dependent methyltransferase
MKIHKRDQKHYLLIRANIQSFLKRLATQFDNKSTLVLDVAPEIHEGAIAYFKHAEIHTLDIDTTSKCTYICDLCETNKNTIPDNTFDLVICTEVLEHTNNPFKAAAELIRVTKPGGYIAITTPFDFRIHNPLPDNWRFTEHGLRLLFNGLRVVDLSGLDSERFLMPIQYTMIVQKP